MAEIIPPSYLTVEQLQISTDRTRVRASFWEFVKYFWSDVPGAGIMIPNWHMELMCDELQKIAERVFQGLPKLWDVAWNISPGTSKSTIASILYPDWIWSRMPQARILSASHTDSLAMDLSNKSRFVLKSENYQRLFPEIQLREDQDTKGWYANTFGGDRMICTVGGRSPMGFHGHWILVDDPLDPKKAVSEAELKVAADFFDAVIPSRKVNKEVSVTFLIMQRLAVSDPTGHLLEKAKREGAGAVRHFCLPAELLKGGDGIYQPDNLNPPELVRNYVDGLMDPTRLPRSVLNERKADGAYHYAGQYLQQPYIAGGGMFKSVFFNNRKKAAPHVAQRVIYCDRASTQNAGCFTSMILMAKDSDGNCYVEKIKRGQWEPYERNKEIRAFALQCRARYGPRNEPVIWIEGEGGSTDKDAWMLMTKALAGFNVRKHRVAGLGSKTVRASYWACQLEAGNCWLIDDGTWDVQAYCDEHVAFPSGKYLDQVDCSSGAFLVLFGGRQAGGIHVRGPTLKKGILQIVVCSANDLIGIPIDDKCILVYFQDPPIPDLVIESTLEEERLRRIALDERSPDNEQVDDPPVVCSSNSVLERLNGDRVSSLPPHALNKLLDSLVLTFSDISPVDYQDRWEETVEPWGKKPSELIMTQQDGKKLWGYLTKKRADTPFIYVLVDEGEGKSVSAAFAICDVLHIPRTTITIIGSDSDEKQNTAAPCLHIYQIVKATRGLVM